MLLSAKVIKGLRLAKKLGFPTLNINPARAKEKKLKQGIYVVEVKTPAGDFSGVLYFGPRHNAGGGLACEAHCFGLKKNLYGRRVKINVKRFLRKPKKFASSTALKRAIASDISAVLCKKVPGTG